MQDKNRNLPYSFDLLYDVKTMKDVEMIASEQAHHSDATPEELVSLFIEEELPTPECLSSFKSLMTIWVCKDGSWLPYKPTFEELHKYQEVKITRFD
jgi:hypothetical protein